MYSFSNESLSKALRVAVMIKLGNYLEDDEVANTICQALDYCLNNLITPPISKEDENA